jgi:hypothetical protein
MRVVRVPLPAVVVLAVLAAFAATRVEAAFRDARTVNASDGATILALAGVRAFTESTDLQALMQIPLGADSMVMKARVFVGDASMGTYAVSVAHVGPAGFRLRSTGRLIAAGASTVCSLDVYVQLDEGKRASMGVQQEPLCNGLRHESAVTSVRNIGS